MSRTVCILGAGASKQAGAPLMREFIDAAWDKGLVREFPLVFDAIHQLAGAQAYGWVDRRNLEAVFAAFEMAKQLGVLGDLRPRSLSRLPDMMARLIERTLVESIRFPTTERGHLLPPRIYQDFLARIKDLDEVSLLTFNYDLCLDFALAQRGITPDYGFDHAPANDQTMRLLKLHGSLGWWHCPKCRKVTRFNPATPIHSRATRMNSDAVFDPSLNAANRTCCGKMIDRPLVVPPTWSKSEHHRKVVPVWQAAAKELQTAENIIVIGYSLPETDQFFRYLYALGTASPTRIRLLRVIDPSDTVRTRFETLLGPDARDRFEYEPYTFGQALQGYEGSRIGYPVLP